MTDLGFFELLSDGVIESIETGPRDTVLMIAPPPSLAALGTSRLRVEARLLVPLHWVNDTGETSLLAELALTNTLRIGPHHILRDGDPVPRVSEVVSVPKSHPASAGVLGRVPLHGTLVGIHADDGRRIKVTELQWTTAKYFAAASKLPTTAELKARQAVVIEALRKLLVENGFTGRAPFFHRENAEVAQAVVLVHSRWNTRIGVSFHIELRAVIGDLRGSKLKKTEDMYKGGVSPRRGVWRASPEREDGVGLGTYGVDASTNTEELAANVVTDVASRLLPWLDALRTSDAVQRAMASPSIDGR